MDLPWNLVASALPSLITFFMSRQPVSSTHHRPARSQLLHPRLAGTSESCVPISELLRENRVKSSCSAELSVDPILLLAQNQCCQNSFLEGQNKTLVNDVPLPKTWLNPPPDTNLSHDVLGAEREPVYPSNGLTSHHGQPSPWGQGPRSLTHKFQFQFKTNILVYSFLCYIGYIRDLISGPTDIQGHRFEFVQFGDITTVWRQGHFEKGFNEWIPNLQPNFRK